MTVDWSFATSYPKESKLLSQMSAQAVDVGRWRFEAPTTPGLRRAGKPQHHLSLPSRLESFWCTSTHAAVAWSGLRVLLRVDVHFPFHDTTLAGRLPRTGDSGSDQFRRPNLRRGMISRNCFRDSNMFVDALALTYQHEMLFPFSVASLRYPPLTATSVFVSPVPSVLSRYP